MKTYNHLLEKIYDKDNIRKAILKAARGKREKHSVQYALSHIDEVVERIHNELKTLSWTPPRYHVGREINDGIQLKKRIVVCPEFIREQCVHHAIMAVLYPLFLPKFYVHSCGSVKGRGTVSAMKYISGKFKKHKKKTKYVSKLDIKKFFANIRPSFVFRELRKTIRDKRVLLILSRILRSNIIVFNGEMTKGGVPIGFYTSPFFANVILNSIDHKVKEVHGVYLYVRYMDDILLSDPSKRRIERISEAISKDLGELRLWLKKKPQCHPLKEITFIGYQFYRSKVILGSKIFLKAKRQFNRASKRNLTVYTAKKILSYSGYFKHADMGLAFFRYISGVVCLRRARVLTSFYERKHHAIC